MRTEKYLSLGAGVQSSVLLLMTDAGVFGELGVDAPAVAVFADTGGEPPDVYDHLDWLESEVDRVEIVRVQQSDLYEDVLAGVNWHGTPVGGGQIPVFSVDARGKKGMKRRECTTNYKIRPIESYIRGRFGQPRPGRLHIESWQGITLDEAYRMKDDPRKSYDRRYPLADRDMTRADCLDWFAARYDRELPRSACHFCPFHSGEEWVRLRERFPDTFADAVKLDNRIRDALPTRAGLRRFLHARCIPLAEAVDADERVVVGQRAQLDFGAGWMNECEGLCAV